MNTKKNSNTSQAQNLEHSTFTDELLKRTREAYRQGEEYLKKYPLSEKFKKIKPVH